MTLRFPSSFLANTALKLACFGAVALVVLNPNLKRAAMQLNHLRTPEACIQTDFPGMKNIQYQINRLAERDPTQPEGQLVERFVLNRIRYVSDYENWWNIEYWPLAREVWELKQEDCDGRAILAASILRARGFSSATLMVGLDHMWVQVDANEKTPGAPQRIEGLLRPGRDAQIKIPKKPGTDHYLQLARAFAQPRALRETVMGVVSDIPALRRLLLIGVLLFLLYHPCTDTMGVIALGAISIAAAAILTHTSPESSPTEWYLGLGLVALGAVLAVVSSRFTLRQQSPRL